jgi:hypothetical protein
MGAPPLILDEDVQRKMRWTQQSDESARTGTPKLKAARTWAAEADRKEAAQQIAERRR